MRRAADGRPGGDTGPGPDGTASDTTASGTTAPGTTTSGTTASGTTAAGGAGGALEVIRAGALTTVQDLGRPGHAHLGVPRSGALDPPAHRLANRLVGNPEGAAGLETTLDGVALRPLGASAVTVAVTGAPCPVRVAGRPVPWGEPVRVPAGAVLEVGRPVVGLRSYVAVAGGIDVPAVLGSRATDLLSGLGPDRPVTGSVLPVGAPYGPPRGADGLAAPSVPPAELVLPLLPGPRDDWFAPGTVAGLGGTPYRVSADGNRIGLRTEGPALVRAREGELPSEGMVLGAVQVPPDGRPVLFLADHPVTGGYPVIGVVPAEHLPAAAQAVPGTPLRFLPIGRP